MKYNFPPTIYVKKNSAKEQLDHIRSELKEASDEFEANNIDAGDKELVDLYHSLETYFRIRSKGNGRGYIQRIFRDVEKKNAFRGYYG